MNASKSALKGNIGYFTKAAFANELSEDGDSSYP